MSTLLVSPTIDVQPPPSTTSPPPTSLPPSPSNTLDPDPTLPIPHPTSMDTTISPPSSTPAPDPSASTLPSSTPPPPPPSGKEEKPMLPTSSPPSFTPPPPSSTPSPFQSPAHFDFLSTSALLDLGRSLLTSRQWSLACEALSRCVERTAASDGEESLTVAPLYHQYGRALFENWRATQTALGEAVHEVQGRVGKIGEGEGGLLGEDDAMDDDAEEDDPVAAAAATHGDDDAAWEVLDLARVIYSRHFTPSSAYASASSAALPSASSSSSSSSAAGAGVLGLSNSELGLSLANVLLLLGDLHQEQEQWAEAYGDYQQALSIQQQLRPLYHRDIASTHTELAVCALYQSQPAQALVHYTQAYITLHYHLMWRTARIRHLMDHALGSPNAGEERLSEELAVEKRLVEEKVEGVEGAWKEVGAERKAMAECRDFIDEMRERIDEMKAEMTKPSTSSASSVTSSSSSSSTAGDSGVSGGFLSSPFAIPSLSFGSSSVASADSSSAAFSSSSSSSSVPFSSPSLKRKAEDDGAAVAAANGSAESVSLPQVKRKKPAPPQ